MKHRKLLDNWIVLLGADVVALWLTAVILKMYRVPGLGLLIGIGLVAFNHLVSSARGTQNRISNLQHVAGLFLLGMIALTSGSAASKLPLWFFPMPLAIGVGSALVLLGLMPMERSH